MISHFSYKATARGLSGLKGSLSRGLRQEPVDLCYLNILNTSLLLVTTLILSLQYCSQAHCITYQKSFCVQSPAQQSYNASLHIVFHYYQPPPQGINLFIEAIYKLWIAAVILFIRQSSLSLFSAELLILAILEARSVRKRVWSSMLNLSLCRVSTGPCSHGRFVRSRQ